MKQIRTIIISITLLLLVSQAFAQGIYRYIDDKGNVRFTDKPMTGWTRVEAGNAMAKKAR